ncbi:MAG TPA: crossover junction endodeoxyribonuclease RuvC [Candidatus Binatia bacterium]|nr:crossover junction endodeoxyribonuclease RuvC [Candidatus Binatia bacterium]
MAGLRVLGIDPGSRVTGWGLVEAALRSPRPIASGTAVPRGPDAAARLGDLTGRIELLLDEWQPVAIAMERAFVGRNVLSALRLGEVRGAVLALAGRRGIPVADYPPATVKRAVTGFGRAEKDAVARGVDLILGGRHAAGDATDALAVAICHVLHAGAERRLAVRSLPLGAGAPRWRVRRA